MNAVERSARWIKYGLGFQDNSKIVVALRPRYNKLLELLYRRRGLVRVLNGAETIRIRPAHRYFRNGFEPALFQFLRQSLQHGDTVIEVGANVGVFTVLLARWVGPRGHVFAFEPSAIARAALEDHLTLNNASEQVQVIPAAVSDRLGKSTFYEHGASGENTLSKTHSRIPDAKAIEVKVTTIDSFCKEHGIIPTLIKIDIEGFELHALRGARQTLTDHRPLLAVELHPMNWPEVGISRLNLETFLKEVGYRASSLGGSKDPLSDYGHVVLRPLGH